MRKVTGLFAAFVGLAASGPRADAAFFTDPAAFAAALNATPTPYTESFDAPRGAGLGTAQATPANFTNGTFSYQISAPIFDLDPLPLYQSANGGRNNSPAFGNFVFNAALTVTFAGTNVTAFGGYFFASDDITVFQSAPITLRVSNGDTLTRTPTSVNGGFIGYTSTAPIASFSLLTRTDGRFNNVDDFTVGSARPLANAVPLPPTAVLGGLSGVLGLLGAARRRVA